MIEKIKLENILFLDIETVSEEEKFSQLSAETQALFAQKTAYQRKEESAEEFYHRAGIWAEFGKIICISVGYFKIDNDIRQFRVTSFDGEGDEKKLLKDFANMLEEFYNQPHHLLCGHNSKEFDFPYIVRRMIIHRIKIPTILNISGKKPWEINHLDTMELWRFGDYKHFTSLKLLTHVLGIASPKEDIDGSQVGEVYYKEKALDRIVLYCQRDVVAVAQIILRLRRDELLIDDEIFYV
jgi:3'-5' exonuclease|uniref:3'-5' exonuclease n=1 Tax=Flavobacterium sp. TaxID=239 RepID=UPI00404A0DAD